MTPDELSQDDQFELMRQLAESIGEFERDGWVIDCVLISKDFWRAIAETWIKSDGDRDGIVFYWRVPKLKEWDGILHRNYYSILTGAYFEDYEYAFRVRKPTETTDIFGAML